MSLNRRDRIRLLEAPDNIGKKKQIFFKSFHISRTNIIHLIKSSPFLLVLICLAVQLHRVSHGIKNYLRRTRCSAVGNLHPPSKCRLSIYLLHIEKRLRGKLCRADGWGSGAISKDSKKGPLLFLFHTVKFGKALHVSNCLSQLSTFLIFTSVTYFQSVFLLGELLRTVTERDWGIRSCGQHIDKDQLEVRPQSIGPARGQTTEYRTS
jgi:hypothetical protein